MSDVPTLNFVSEQDNAGPSGWNFVLYGPAGQGKTTAACSAPGPVVVLNAEGPGALRYARQLYGREKLRELRFEGQPTLNQLLDYLRKGGDGEQTVVVDSLGEVYTRLLRGIGGRSPQIQHYGQVNTIIEDFCRDLRDLPVNVVLLAHEQIEDSEEGGALRRPQTGGKKLPEVVMGLVDVVAYCGVLPPEEEGGDVRYMGQLVQAKGRRAKDRSGALGAVRPLDLSEWIETMDAALQPGDGPADDLPWEEAFAARADEKADDEPPVQPELGAAA